MVEPGRRELSRRGLLGPEEGWSLAPVGAWIMMEGRHITDPIARLDALAARLQSMSKQAGVPLLLSKEFAAHIRRAVRSIGHFDLRGIGGPQEMFTPEDEPQA